MSERADLFCGCAFIKAGGQWYQVVACPEHVMDMKPMAEPKARPRG
jgi:hypothetical protein